MKEAIKMPKTSEQIQQEIEAKLNELPAEEREAILAADQAQDIAMCLALSRKTGHNIEVIPNDRHHIKVDGEVMGYVEFGAWMQANMHEADDTEEDEDEEEGGEA